MKKVFSMAPATKIMATVLLASACLLPSVARAEIKQGSFEINPFAGYNFFEKSQNLKDRPVYGGRIGYNFTDRFGLELGLAFVNTRVDDKAQAFGGRGVYLSPINKVDIATYNLDAIYHFMPQSRFNPFVIAGVGATQYHPKIANHDMATVDFGVGAKYWLTEHVALRADIRDNVVSELFRYAYHNVQATAGVVVAFGGHKHTEDPAPVAAAAETPAPVAAVECPVPAKDTTAPTVSLTAPMKGATDANTNKKVYVSFSEPIDQKTMNGDNFYLQHGDERIPATVTDATATSESLAPASDLKPDTLYTATVTTGTKDLAGNAMAKDYVWTFKTAALPKTKVETRVETKVETKVVVVSKLVMLEGTHFQFDKADLNEAGKGMLDQNVKIMKDNSAIKVSIAGHTSAAGSAAYNQKLSERRAAAAKTYMVASGIAPERLETIGYGKTRPAVIEKNPKDRNSKAAKANMRVVFDVVNK